MREGDLVEVVNSPYEQVPNGTRSRISKIKLAMDNGKEYILVFLGRELPNNLFYSYELKMVRRSQEEITKELGY